MATPKFLLSNLLRRRRPQLTIELSGLPPSSSSSSSSYSYLIFIQSPNPTINANSKSYFKCSIYCPPPSIFIPPSVSSCNLLFPRSFSTLPDSELPNPSFTGDVVVGEDSILPVRPLISLLDAYHDLTGFPWWLTIASSTLALRLALFPLLVLQLHKLKKISELFPKLPRPLPPPLSGRSFGDQMSLFWQEKRALGCPSFLWFLAYFSIQFPCFLLWMTSIRRMSLDHHSGFDSGGTLWFQNLTEYPHGALGAIFPLSIAALHFINIQISFHKMSIGKMPGLFGLLAKYYKRYLDVLTLPLLFITFYVPQGSLVYWATNGSLTLIQQLLLNHPYFRKMLGLPYKEVAKADTYPGESVMSSTAERDLSTKLRHISLKNLSPQELVALSVKSLTAGHKDGAIPLLQLALDKDPVHVSALIIMGQVLLQKGSLVEAIEYLERAISKLFFLGHPTDVENVHLLIVASLSAGTAHMKQGKKTEGIVHLERVARLKEPDDPNTKAQYFDGLVIYASALYSEGRKAEAAKYLRMAAAYNPDYNVYLQQCENDDDLVDDLIGSRRADY